MAKLGRPKTPNSYNERIVVFVNKQMRRALRTYKTTEGAAARGLIVAGLLRDKLITNEDLPGGKR